MRSIYSAFLVVCFGAALAPAQGPQMGSCPVFPADHIWNTPIDTLPVAANSSTYINTIGGQELYSKDAFATHGVALEFIKTRPICYQQGEGAGAFVANLSIIDVMMFNSKESIRAMLGKYDLV